MNQGSGGIVSTQTGNSFALRTAGANRVIIDAAGDLTVRRTHEVEGKIMTESNNVSG